jgi:sugar/nucleoside kinase (ribokinase family)
VSVDVVCADSVFLDLTFEGLEALPGPGEERHARDLHATPGGAASTAIGLVRLGLRAAVVAPLGRDFAGTLLRSRLEREGVVCAGPETGRTPVTVVLPVGGERAMVTFEPPFHPVGATVERLRPRAVVTGLDGLDLAPAGAALYVGAGYGAAGRFASRLPATIARARALVVNRAESLLLTGELDAAAAALALAQAVETAVVTCGAEGAVAAADGALVSVAAPAMEARDTTGAGDLFTAAYVWGDLAGLPLPERLRRATVYAALSVRTATAAASAATRDELERALAELGPSIVQMETAKEHP